MKKDRYDFTKALRREKGSIMEYGSEFREVGKLKPLMWDHKHWKIMSTIMSEGVRYSLEDLPEKTRKTYLTYMMARGNHKSAADSENMPTLLKKYQK